MNESEASVVSEASSLVQEHAVQFHSAGRTFAATSFAPPGTTPRPGVLVLHGGAGVSDHERERARMLAELGHVALVPDLFGEQLTSREQGIAVIMALVTQPAILRQRVADAVAALRALSSVDATRIAVIGFCFGGLAALELARSGANVQAVVSFHGGLESRSPATSGTITSRILVCTGAADPFVTQAHRLAFEQEMNSANASYDMLLHGGALHGFTERTLTPRPGCAYDERADRTSWQAMRTLLTEVLAPA